MSSKYTCETCGVKKEGKKTTRFCRAHSPWFNSKKSEWHKKRISDGAKKWNAKPENRRFSSEIKKAEKNPNWKGDEVGYQGIHSWINRRLPKPLVCDDCKDFPPKDLANISNRYLRDLSDWEWLCRKCHMKKDGRLEKFKSTSFKRTLDDITCSWCSISFRPRDSTKRFCSRVCGGKGAAKKRLCPQPLSTETPKSR